MQILIRTTITSILLFTKYFNRRDRNTNVQKLLVINSVVLETKVLVKSSFEFVLKAKVSFGLKVHFLGLDSTVNMNKYLQTNTIPV